MGPRSRDRARGVVGRLIVTGLAAASLVALAPFAQAAGPGKAGKRGVPVVFVANAEEGTVSIVHARRPIRVLREIDVLPDGPDAAVEDDPLQSLAGQALVEAAGGANYAQDTDVSPNGRRLYVSRGHRGDFAAFRIRDGELLWRTSVEGLRSDHMTISADGGRLYVSDMTANRVHVVAVRTGEILGSFVSGEWPHDNHLSQDGNRLYNASLGNILVPTELRAANPQAYRLKVVDPDSLEVLRSYPFDAGIRPFVLDERNARIFAQLSELHGIVEFNLRRGEIARRLELPIDPGVTEDDYDFEAPHHGLDISGNRRLLCAAGRASDYVALVSTRGLRRRAVIDVGNAPGWAATGPRGRGCFVPNTREDTLSVISYRKRAEIARIAVGDGPKHITAARIPRRVALGASRRRTN